MKGILSMSQENTESPETPGRLDRLVGPSFDRMLEVYRFEQETNRKVVEIERLFELARHDPTVRTFIEAWQRGHCRSFEEMLCKLAVQLATEKAEYLKTATKAIQLAPSSSLVVADVLS